MPIQKITKEMVVDTAFKIAREEGLEKVVVKHIAERLNCSVQPIYSYCASMDGLKQDLILKTAKYFQEYIEAHIDHDNLFVSTGYCYNQLAINEPHLFKLYFFRKRSDIYSFDDIYKTECNPQVAQFLAKTENISLEKAKQLHINMLIFNMGISTIMATSESNISTEEIQQKLQEAFTAFTK